jgi:hypothetical protein
MKARVKEMEEEASKLRDMTAEVEKTMNGPEEGRFTKNSFHVAGWTVLITILIETVYDNR